MNRQERHSHNI